MFYKTCRYCGANLDPDEVCDCKKKETTPLREQPPKTISKLSIVSLSTSAFNVKILRGCLDG
ncbi:MAG: hypothetical protein GYA71_01100 [Bacteroidales bacterium]|jgi:hypothetical protein|nr:hypothetical protein [Bacteroidales bacterium]